MPKYGRSEKENDRFRWRLLQPCTPEFGAPLSRPIRRFALHLTQANPAVNERTPSSPTSLSVAITSSESSPRSLVMMTSDS